MNWQKIWAVNKYWVMSKSQQQYDHIRLLAKNNQCGCKLIPETTFKRGYNE